MLESFLFAFNAVSPIIVTVAIGYLLKKAGLMNGEFSKAANKIVFKVCLPAMLFLNVYKIENLDAVSFGYIVYAVTALLALFALFIPVIMAVTKKGERRGVLLQASFRSNYALIGIPLAQALFGDAGVAVASILSAFFIPLLNVLAVISLSVFKDGKEKVRVKKILLNIVQNPLIQSVLLGILTLVLREVFKGASIEFRLSQLPFIYKSLTYLSNVATPLALLVLGAQFEFSAVKELRREIFFGTLLRIGITPLFAIGAAYLFFSSQFTGAHFAAFVAAFATPVAVSSVPMAQEMEGDTALAGQLVVWTTLFSALSVFLASMLLKLAGVFS